MHKAEENALAHIDFLIDADVRERLGITDRELDVQVLRLCSAYNDVVELMQAQARNIIDLTDELENCKRVLKDNVICTCYGMCDGAQQAHEATIKSLHKAYNHAMNYLDTIYEGDGNIEFDDLKAVMDKCEELKGGK